MNQSTELLGAPARAGPRMLSVTLDFTSERAWELYASAITVFVTFIILLVPVLRFNCRKSKIFNYYCCCLCPRWRGPARILAKDLKETITLYKLLSIMVVSMLLRIVWLMLQGMNVLGANAGCLSGMDCVPQVFVTLTNRLSQLAFFVTASRVMKYLGFAAHASAFNYQPWLVPSSKLGIVSNDKILPRGSSSGSVRSAKSSGEEVNLDGATPTQKLHYYLKLKLSELAVMGWDVSHIALDWWMIVLQVSILFITLFTPIAYDNVFPIYEAYQLQVGTMYLLLGVLYGLIAYQYRSLVWHTAWQLVRNFLGRLCCCLTSADSEDEAELGDLYNAYGTLDETNAEVHSSINGALNDSRNSAVTVTTSAATLAAFQRPTSTGPKRTKVAREMSAPVVHAQATPPVYFNRSLATIPSETQPLADSGQLPLAKVVAVRNRPSLTSASPSSNPSPGALPSPPSLTGNVATPLLQPAPQPSPPLPSPTHDEILIADYNPQAYVRFAVVCALISAFFIIRTVLFMYTPLTRGDRIQGLASEVLYPWFFYTAPEAIPPLLILHLLLPGGLQSALTGCRQTRRKV